jgi:hypothetical protein
MTRVLSHIIYMLIVNRLQFLNPEVEFYTKLRPSYLNACEGTIEFDGMP